MAKKQNKRTDSAYKDPDDIERVAGVETSRKGNDRGPEHLYRREMTCVQCRGSGKVSEDYETKQFERVVLTSREFQDKKCPLCKGKGLLDIDHVDAESLALQEIQQSAAAGRSNRAARVDNLERMFNDEQIDQRQFDAGKDFQKYFQMGQLAGYPPTKLEWTPPSTGERDPGGDIRHGRNKIYKAMERMGGFNSERAIAAWHFIGLCEPLSSIGKSGPARVKWATLLKCAIEDIADAYYPLSKKFLTECRQV